MNLTITGLPVRQGKVRDIYNLKDKLLLVSTDRISAFDWVFPTLIPDKGRVLNLLSKFWFDMLDHPHHCITTDVDVMVTHIPVQSLQSFNRFTFAGRCMLVKTAFVFPIECVVRGYLEGSGWKEYQQTGGVCGVPLPAGLRQCDRLPEPIFTPATKEENGHDQNITFADMGDRVGTQHAQKLRDVSLALYQRGAEYAAQRGIIIADTKFEFGLVGDDVLLVDEVFTPDSSRFWPADQYEPGHSQPSLDKQYVREFVEQESGWDKNSPPPSLPQEVVTQTSAKYIAIYERLTGKQFPWK